MLADDVERVTTARSSITLASSLKKLPQDATVVAGTVGHSRIIDELVRQKAIDVSAVKGQWESYIITTVNRPRQGPLLVIAGSDRRGTAFGLTSLSEAIGVSPWYWWADVTPQHKQALFIEPGTFVQEEPSVQYRGIFINDERFGGWARWAEQKHGKVGPETRVKTNGRYENTYTLGLRGIHDYPMEGANTTAERVALMQQAIDDQRDMLRRNIKKPIEEIPQVLCTYEEVLDAYHNGLKVPEDVTLLWSDDKHGYCRNLCNPEEMKRKGGAGIYYHLSYHGDPASWIWLSPLSTAFLSTELTKAYTYGARKIWVFNVGDIKPAEKEISFVMDLAWDINRWKPSEAHNYTKYWAAKTFGNEVAQEIADIQAGYYRLQAAGKDAHVWFVNYSAEQIEQRIVLQEVLVHSSK